eukprot:TRINITY_DN1429_c0_g3_i1.p1 TRINITY_DN1429_c0_g3~~TRINITY_DN1429_c0_g3_i1.p1  ORF type:complete len:250 (+),score=29.37 TRINITY_DN1429_c0_g3_i1:75-824(+)
MDEPHVQEYLTPKTQPRYSLVAKLIAEFIGTAAFVFFGAGTASHPGVELTAVSAAHGVITMILILLFAPVSGAHFNAGPTLVLGVADLFKDSKQHALQKVGEIFAYLVAQGAGCIVGGYMVLGIYGSSSSLGTPALNSSLNVTQIQGFLIELFGTFFLMIVIQMVANQPLSSQATAIGGMLFVIFLVGAPLDGAAMNPWRWLGPAVASQTFKPELWIYWAGPIGGFAAGYIAFVLYQRLIYRGVVYVQM